MELTTQQNDALTELINIGYGRAAGALSELTGYRITLEVPRVAVHEIEELAPILSKLVPGEVASVNQIFSGPISGNALLLLDEPSALFLSQLLLDNDAPTEFDASAREVITEVGNILLNACLGVFGNLLQVQVSFAVPRLQVETVPHLLGSISIESQEKLRHAMVVHTRFRLRASDVTGYFAIILGVASLDRTMHELEAWERRQSQ